MIEHQFTELCKTSQMTLSAEVNNVINHLFYSYLEAEHWFNNLYSWFIYVAFPNCQAKVPAILWL